MGFNTSALEVDSGKWEEKEQECKTEEITHRMFQHRNCSLMTLEICFPVSNKMEKYASSKPSNFNTGYALSSKMNA